MSRRQNYFLMIPILSLTIISLSISGCKENKEVVHSVITEVYEVQLSDDNYAAGKMEYMEDESYKGDKIQSKTIYNNDLTVKGKEVYQYSKNSPYPSGSRYFGSDGKLMSTYQFEYEEDSLRSASFAYEGDSENLLRIERFKYDDKANRVMKTIHDANNVKNRTFLFGHDANGNETSMTILNEKDVAVITETFEILKVDQKGRWIEKYGYVNKNNKPTTHYKCKRND